MRRLLPIFLLLLPLTACVRANGSPTTAAGASARAEANVVQGVVSDLQGDPVPNATVTVSGYTGRGGNVVERAVTDAQGRYRLTVPSGLYDVEAEVELTFDGETYHLYLHPAEGGCGEEAYSADGIVRDFTFKVAGFKECPAGLDPGNQHSYSGGTVGIRYGFPRTLPADAVATFTLTPRGPRADGSTGEVLTFTRTVQQLDAYSGPPGSSMYLYDLPLGLYEIAGTVSLPDGTVQQLRFGDYVNGGAAYSYAFGFDPVLMWPYGIRVTDVGMYDANWAP